MPSCRFTLTGPKPPRAAYPKELKNLGDHLRKRRLDLGLTQRQVAAQIGACTSSIRSWESNATTPALRFMPAIIRFLGHAPVAEPGSFPDRVKVTRRVLGLSQRRLADLLGVDEGTVGRWERGRSWPRSEVPERLNAIVGKLFR